MRNVDKDVGVVMFPPKVKLIDADTQMYDKGVKSSFATQIWVCSRTCQVWKIDGIGT